MEYTDACIYSNLHFENSSGERLNEYVPLIELKIKDGDELYARLEGYSEAQAKLHITKFKRILLNPPLPRPTVNEKISPGDNINIRVKEEEKKGEMEKKGEEEKKEEVTVTGSNGRTKSPSGEATKAERESKEAREKVNNTEWNKSISKALMESKYNLSNKLVKCIERLTFSPNNPPSSTRRLAGDLFYLIFLSLEGTTHQITSHVSGFFLNYSENANGAKFNPNPRMTDGRMTYAPTLSELCALISPLFTKNFHILLNIGEEALPFTQIMPIYPIYPWMVQPPSKSEINKFGTFSLPFNSETGQQQGFLESRIEKRVWRDWNDEFQICQELPTRSLEEKLEKQKSFFKQYADFCSTVKECAIQIIEGTVQPLNPMDSDENFIFVYNQIFFSLAKDLALTFSELSEEEILLTYQSSNHDLRGIKLLHQLDMKGIHILATCIVNYKGRRMVAQSILPGVLHAMMMNEQTTVTDYGSMDDSKTIKTKETFTELMADISRQFTLKSSLIKDASGNLHKMEGPYDIKGVTGTDKRRYLLDIVRLTPRDLNFPGLENGLRLVRSEMVNVFQQTKKFEFATEEVHAFARTQERMQEERIKSREEEIRDSGSKTSEEKKKMYDGYRIEDATMAMERVNIFKKAYAQAPQLSFNVNLHTKARLADDQEVLDNDDKLLRELAKFIADTEIPKILKNLEGSESLPVDNEAFTNMLHQHGLNLRYIGMLVENIDRLNINIPWFKLLCERVAIIRSAKHIINQWIKNSHTIYISHVIAHFLNLLLSPKETLERMEKNGLKEGDRSIQPQIISSVEKIRVSIGQGEKEPVKEKSRKKKKKAKKEQGALPETKKLLDLGGLSCPLIEYPIYLSKTPSELWEEIQNISEKRYEYKLSSSQYECPSLTNGNDKYAILRDLCLCIGIQLECKDYTLMSKSKSNRRGISPPISISPTTDTMHENVSFTSTNIINLFPVSKRMDMVSVDARLMIENGKRLQQERKHKEAFEVLTQAMQLQGQICGPLNVDVAFCSSRIANILFNSGEVEQAIEYSERALIISEKTSGCDHPLTIQQYATLAMYLHAAGEIEDSFAHLQRAILFMDKIAGHNHPESSALYLNLGLLYLDNEMFPNALHAFGNALRRHRALFGEDSVYVAKSYQALGMAYYQMGDFRKALSHEEKAYAIFNKVTDYIILDIIYIYIYIVDITQR